MGNGWALRRHEGAVALVVVQLESELPRRTCFVLARGCVCNGFATEILYLDKRSRPSYHIARLRLVALFTMCRSTDRRTCGTGFIRVCLNAAFVCAAPCSVPRVYYVMFQPKPCGRHTLNVRPVSSLCIGVRETTDSSAWQRLPDVAIGIPRLPAGIVVTMC